MNPASTPARSAGTAPGMRLPHQRPGVERGLSRGGLPATGGVEPSFVGLDSILKLARPLSGLFKSLF